ncbi:YcaO-like family protein, partial [Streptomyces sp. NRRL WC-3725]|uniref:YcaO-like family protein n=1 Tax=Streptomyces sp. NRRL WC-3725 TaxID=1463933 RepID=UPI0005B9A6E2
GLLEVVERDALELWWHLDGPTRGIDPASVPGLTEDLAGAELDVRIVEMPSEFAPCVAALVHDPRRGIHAAGFACRYDPAEAADGPSWTPYWGPGAPCPASPRCCT